MPKKLLFFCELSSGHFNVAISLACVIQRLYGDKYEIWFLVDNEYKRFVNKKLKNIKFLIYSRNPNQIDDDHGTTKYTIEFFSKFGDTWNEQDRVKFCLNGGHNFEDGFNETKELHPTINKLIQDLNPDLILIDCLVTVPTAINLNIPYVQILSAAPTFFGHHQLPPPRSALPSEYTEENRKLWDDFIKKVYGDKVFVEWMKKANQWLKDENSPVNFDDKYIYYCASKTLNVYNYPKELDYQTEIVRMPGPGKWVRIDSAVTDTPDPFPVPDKLKNLPGNLIYFSLGSMASCYKPLMNRLLKLFSEIPHRFIVSTGLIGEEYKLYDNQYGEKYIYQLAVLQTVDVYISHCGNNGLTESCHFGKPIVAIPLFADQPDNAVRVMEKGCGIKLDAFNSTKEEFEKAIEFCLREDVQERMKTMSNRIKKDNNLKKVCETIVNLIE